ncbi:MAG: dihydrofolate reductase [Acidimicrobiia bacterium]|jgi:dihydrofolate reductase
MTTVIVAAVGRNGVIGVDGRLPWQIPEDLARFKQITMGQSLVMGRSTFESIGRPLPGRANIVLSRRADWSHDGVEVAGSLDSALSLAASRGHDAYVVGGAEVYRLALDVADRLELTEVDAEPEGDTWFPDVDWACWREVARQSHPGFAFVTYERARPDPPG